MSLQRATSSGSSSRTGRYLAARTLVGSTVAALTLLPAAEAPTILAPALVAWVVASSLIVNPLLRKGGGVARGALGALLLCDLITGSLLVAATGGGRSPFVLVHSLTIASAGLFIGLWGGIAAALGATVGLTAVILISGGGFGVAPILTSFLLLLLGALFGRLGRRIADQSQEMNRVRSELERAELDAEAIVASITGPLLCLDDRGTIRRVNAAAAALLGFHGDPTGKRIDRVGDTRRLAPLLEFVEQLFQGGDFCVEIELPDRRFESHTPVEVAASCIRDREGNVQGLVLLLSDLTRRREQEAEQARRERLAVVGELAGHLAHEIRNSLKPVVGSVELLVGEVPMKGSAGELMAIILREAESLESFLTDFLTFSRDKSLTLAEVDIDELIEEQVAALSRHPARQRGVTLRAVSESGGERVLTDRQAVRDILRNLMINALEATEAGMIEVSHRFTGGDLEIAVEDRGVGLPEGDTETLFEPFCTHKPGGTGLGLSIARKIARRLDGEVTLDPRRNGGVRACLVVGDCRTHRLAA